MSNSKSALLLFLFHSRNDWKGEWGRARDERFNKALARPVCGPHCRIKSCFHRSHSPSASTSPPPTQCQVLLWDTQQRVCVCVCSRMPVLLPGSSTLKHLSKKPGPLLNWWNTLIPRGKSLCLSFTHTCCDDKRSCWSVQDSILSELLKTHT